MISPVDALAAAKEGSQIPGLPANDLISKEQFLILFIEQLKNQDPLSPLQPNELTGQLAQFSSLEQLTGINERLDALAGSAKETTSSALLGLIGKSVRFEGGHLVLRDGEASSVTYALEAGADRVTATVRAADGSVVRVVELGSQGAGEHTVTFDGDGEDGSVLPDGSYTVEITAAAPGADPEIVPVSSLATVDGVDLSSDPPTVLVAGQRIALEQIHEVRAATAAP